jgi:hypothetical protein
LRGTWQADSYLRFKSRFKNNSRLASVVAISCKKWRHSYQLSRLLNISLPTVTILAEIFFIWASFYHNKNWMNVWPIGDWPINIM